MPKPLIALLAIALAACTGGGGGGAASSEPTAVAAPGTAVISDHNISSDAITITWSKTEGADAESWSAYHNDSVACSAELSASGDNQQSGSCSFTLVDGTNSIYVQLCNSSAACSSSETLEIEHSLPPGAIYLEQLPSTTTSNQLEVTWVKEQGANGDLWYIFHNGQSACSGSLTLEVDQQPQSAGCSIDLDFGEHQFQARLCIDKPVHSADVCTDSPVQSLTSYFDSALELATPVIDALEASLPALATTISWSKNTEKGSAGESWTFYQNDEVICGGTLAADEAAGSCSLTLQEGSNSLFVRLCTEVATYSGASCVDSAVVAVEGTNPYALEPGAISITSVVSAQTYEPSLIIDWAINSGNGVSQWYVQLNDSSRCLSSSGNYLFSGSCSVDLELGVNTISVVGCNYGQENTQSCATSAELSTEYIAFPGTPEITSSFPATTYASELNLSWQRTEGEPADYWLGVVNDSSKCSGDLLEQTPQSGSCSVELDSGVNAVIARLCLANVSGSGYCSDSTVEQIELLAPVPAQAVISTPEQSVAEAIDVIALEWSKSSGANGSYWSLDNNGETVAACSGQLPLSSGSSQSGSCSLPLSLGSNLVSVHLCEDNAAGTASCSISESVTIVRGSLVLEFTSASSASSAENNSEVFYTATVSADGSPTAASSFDLSGVDSSLFSIDSSGGLAFVNPPDFESPQDYDQDNTYELNISATYLGYSTRLEFSVSVSDSNDETPQVPSSETSTTLVIATITLDSVIYTVEASDADADDILTYSLAGVDASHFNLNSSSGELRFTQLPSVEQPQDFDGDNIYDLAISVSDAAANSSSFTLAVIAIAESVPEFSSASASVEFPENSTAIAYDANATDADGDSLSYSLAGTDAAHFNLDPASGQLSFSQAPDFELPQDQNQDNIYELVISATDNTHSIALDLNVSVSNINEALYFEASSSSLDLSENDASSLALPAAIDPEASNAITYELLAIAEGNSDYQHFNLTQPESSTAPSIAFADPAGADYENTSDHNSDHTYEFILQASDATHSASIDINLTITNSNDNSPIFTDPNPEAISVPENTSTDTILYTASATDADGDTITYSLTGLDSAYFDLGSASGQLSFKSAPDFEDPFGADNTYSLEISAADADTAITLALSIEVTNLNDNAPTFADPDPDAISVAENTSTDTILYTASASDADGDAIAYSLTGSDSAHFNFDSDTAALSFKQSPDFDSPQDQDQDNTYAITVTATEADSTHSTSVDLSVEVSNIDEAPQFAIASEAIAVPENTSTASIIYTAAASDEDGDTITYTLSGTDAAQFILSSTTGALNFATSPDFENPQDQDGDNDYHIEIQATSTNNGVKSTANLQLSIAVTDIDETPPYFTEADSVVTLVEDPATEGQQIAVLALEFAVYDDADDAASRALSLELEGDDSSLFQISSSGNSHQVHFITSPDYDHTHDANQDCNYSFSVVATDSDGNEAKHSATIVITGVIDEAPYIDPASYTRGEIIAIAGNDTDPFLTLAGYDEDRSSWNYQTESWRYRDNFDTLSFTLTSTIAESDSDLFLLDPDTLELSLKASLNPENPQQNGGTDNLYQVEVAIIDSAGNSNLTDGSDTASRIVYVQVGEFVDKGSEPVDSGPQIPWFSSSEISLLSEKVDIAIPWVIHVGEGAISWEMYVNGTLECSYAVADLSSPVTSGHCMVAADKFSTKSTANNAWVIVCYLDNTCAQSETAIFGYAADVSYHPNYNFSYENPGTAADCGEVEIGDPVTHDNNTRCYNYLLETDSFGGKYYRSGLTYLDHDFGYNFDVVAYFIEWGVYARDFDPHDMPVDYLSTILYSFIKFEGDNTTANDECENCTFSGAVAIADTWAALDKPFYWPGAEEYYADQAETEEELAEVLAEKADMTGRGIFQQFWLLKQKFPRLQTCLSVGGWTFSRPFPLVASDPAKRAVFAESIVDMAVEYHFDCIDIDWEFPGKAGGDRVATHNGVATYDLDGDGISPFVDPSPADADYFVALIAELRAEIDSRAEAKHIEINSAVYTSSEGMALMNYGAFADDLDGIHMMTYDYYGAWDPHTGLQAALYANTDPVSDDVALAYGNPYNPQHNIASAMARGVNNAINNGFRSELSVSEANSGIRQKIVPGLAFYGRNYSGVNMDEPVPGKYMVRATGTTGNSDGSAEQLGWEPGNLNYAQIEGYYNHGSSVKGNADYDAGGYSTADREWTYNWDDESQTPFLYDADTASFVTYSDPRAIYYQTCHAAWHNSKGVMFWEISGDSEDFDLVAAIHAALSGEPLDDYRYNPQPSCTDLDTIDYGDIAYGPGAYADLSGIKDLQDLEDYGYISQEILDSLFFFNEEYHSDYLYGSIVNEECTDYNFLSDWEALKQTASEHFPKFASEGSIEDRLRELAAFFAFTAEYTMYGRDWGFYKLDPNKNVVYQDGYCHKEPPECADQSSCDQKCDADDEEYGYACSLGNSYHSRGHFHLSGSHNYGAMSEALFGDNDYTLLENPDLLATDVNLSWSSALWYWMNHEERELPYDDIPSPHNAIIGNFTAEPEWGRYPGLGFVTAVLSAYNGGDQCDEDSWRHGDSLKLLEPPAKHRLGFYLTYLNILSSNHVKYGYEPLSPWVTDTEGNTHGVYPATYAEFDLNEDDLIDRYTDVKKYLTCADMLAYD